jgi:hypothetical protein
VVQLDHKVLVDSLVQLVHAVLKAPLVSAAPRVHEELLDQLDLVDLRVFAVLPAPLVFAVPLVSRVLLVQPDLAVSRVPRVTKDFAAQLASAVHRESAVTPVPLASRAFAVQLVWDCVDQRVLAAQQAPPVLRAPRVNAVRLVAASVAQPVLVEVAAAPARWVFAAQLDHVEPLVLAVPLE